MDKNRFPVLVLAGALTLTLAACGGKTSETPTPVPIDTSAVSESAEPSAAPTESTEPDPEPTETVEAGPSGSDAPSIAPTPAPTDEVQSHPVEIAPVSTPAPTAEPESSLTAADVYAAVSARAGGSTMIDSSFALDSYYNIAADDLEDFVLYMPDMSANIEEIFIAKVKSGKLDAVKAACESRQKGMTEDAAAYPATGTYVDGYKLVTNGDWVLFCVCENPDGAVTAFNDCTK